MTHDEDEEPGCPACEDAKPRGCPECNDDLAECDRCGTVEERCALDDDLVCRECRDEDEHQRQLRSDYRHSVL